MPLDESIRRYLDALSGSSSGIRRSERANCRSLAKFISQSGYTELSRELIQGWLDSTEEHQHDLRKRRISTLRRLLALTPGAQAELLAAWIDGSRKRLIENGHRDNVVQLRPVLPTMKEDALRYAERGRALYAKGSHSRAASLARRALRVDHFCLRAHALLGLLDLEAGRPNLALKRFREALVLSGDPSQRNGTGGVAAVLDGLGQTLLSVGHLSEAFEVFHRLCQAGPKWEAEAAPALGRIAMLRDEYEAAAEWFQHAPPLHQYNVYLARWADGDYFRAFIGLCRGLLANPVIPAELLQTGEHRFMETIEPDKVVSLSEEAERYVLKCGDLWVRWPGATRSLRRLWDHPAIRTFLMRALPVARATPASPRLAVFVHACASQLKTEFETMEEELTS